LLAEPRSGTDGKWWLTFDIGSATGFNDARCLGAQGILILHARQAGGIVITDQLTRLNLAAILFDERRIDGRVNHAETLIAKFQGHFNDAYDGQTASGTWQHDNGCYGDWSAVPMSNQPALAISPDIEAVCEDSAYLTCSGMNKSTCIEGFANESIRQVCRPLMPTAGTEQLIRQSGIYYSRCLLAEHLSETRPSIGKVPTMPFDQCMSEQSQQTPVKAD
jgi:hypothetical protein